MTKEFILIVITIILTSIFNKYFEPRLPNTKNAISWLKLIGFYLVNMLLPIAGFIYAFFFADDIIISIIYVLASLFLMLQGYINVRTKHIEDDLKETKDRFADAILKLNDEIENLKKSKKDKK